MERIDCERCEGNGIITTMEPAPIWGSKLRSATRTVPMNRFCYTCNGRGTIDREPEPPAGPPATGVHAVKVEVSDNTDSTITVGGYRIQAPAFRDAAQFDRAIQRAFDAGLRVESTDRPGMFLVINPAGATSYTTSRRACSCPAGQSGTPCMHIAIVCFMLDVAGKLSEVAA